MDVILVTGQTTDRLNVSNEMFALASNKSSQSTGEKSRDYIYAGYPWINKKR